MNPINDNVNNTTVFIRNIEIKLLLTFYFLNYFWPSNYCKSNKQIIN